MITEQYIYEEEIIKASDCYKKREKILDICIITFSYKIFSFAKEMEGSEVVGELFAASGVYEIVKLPVKEKRVGIFLSPCGAPAAGGFMEDVNAVTGAENFILFGSCGSLDEKKTTGRYIVVDAAYRDEGLSYHYIPPSDYVSVPTWSVIRYFFEKKQIPFVVGKTWTTDAFYRETRGSMERRKEEGCIVVEMEIAGCQAVAERRGWKLYPFLESGDVLDGEEWKKGNLGGANHENMKLFLALELARMIES